MEKVEKYILEYQKKVKNCKYKVSVADYEAAYHDAKVNLDKYGYEWSCSFDKFYSGWYTDYWWDGFIYVNDIDELVYDKLTEDDKKIIRNFLKKIVVKVK